MVIKNQKKIMVLILMLMVGRVPEVIANQTIINNKSPVLSLDTVGMELGASPTGAKLVDATLDDEGNIYVLSSIHNNDDYFGKVVNFYVYKYSGKDNQWSKFNSFDACESASLYATPSEISLGKNGDVWMIGRPQSSDTCDSRGNLIITKNGVLQNIHLLTEYTPKAIKLTKDDTNLIIAGVIKEASAYTITTYQFDLKDIANTPIPIVVKNFTDLSTVPDVYFKVYLPDISYNPVVYLVNAGNYTIYDNIAILQWNNTYKQLHANIFDRFDTGTANLYAAQTPIQGAWVVAWNPDGPLVKSGYELSEPYSLLSLPSDAPRAASPGDSVSMTYSQDMSYLAYISRDRTLQLYQLNGSEFQLTGFAGDVNGVSSDGVKLFSTRDTEAKPAAFIAYSDLKGNGITVKRFYDFR